MAYATQEGPATIWSDDTTTPTTFGACVGSVCVRGLSRNCYTEGVIRAQPRDGSTPTTEQIATSVIAVAQRGQCRGRRN
ncbi:MAG TPA: hypothetical protein VLB73_00325 [Patescibacteria group bacterium]|nr:hypothetical protein [Patescibacteria group bacterium]